MTIPLGTLLKESAHVLLRRWQPILIAAAVIAAVMTAGQMLIVGSAAESIGSRIGSMERMEELSKRMEAGDPSALEDMMKEIGLMFLIFMIVSCVASTYFLVFALNEKETLQSALRKVPSVLLPLIGVWIWAFLRSFAWMPIIGIVFAIVIGPRLALAPVILLREKKGITESVASSYTRTRGYWGKIAGNGIVAGLCIWIAMLLLGMVTGIVSFGSMTLGVLFASVVQWVGTAYLAIFLVKLSDTILANPLQVRGG